MFWDINDDFCMLLVSKKCCNFATVISSRLGIMSFGWGNCRHNKGVITRFVLGFTNLENS